MPSWFSETAINRMKAKVTDQLETMHYHTSIAIWRKRKK